MMLSRNEIVGAPTYFRNVTMWVTPPPPPCFCVSRGNKGVTGEFRGCRGSKAHYLPLVYYYLVGTSFETGTRLEWENPRPSLSLRGWGTRQIESMDGGAIPQQDDSSR